VRVSETARSNFSPKPGRSAIHPFLVALPLLAIAGFVSAAGVGARIGWWPWFLTLGGLLASAAAVRAGIASLERRRRGQTIDEWLLQGTAPTRVVSWRADELTSARRRRKVGRGIWRVERELRGRVLPGPLPLNKRAIRSNLGLLQTLRETLEECRSPVNARGMLLARRLLNEPRSPLHADVPVDALAAALTEILAEFDHSPAAPAVTTQRR
jgi:hypothetical protein